MPAKLSSNTTKSELRIDSFTSVGLRKRPHRNHSLCTFTPLHHTSMQSIQIIWYRSISVHLSSVKILHQNKALCTKKSNRIVHSSFCPISFEEAFCSQSSHHASAVPNILYYVSHFDSDTAGWRKGMKQKKKNCLMLV